MRGARFRRRRWLQQRLTARTHIAREVRNRQNETGAGPASGPKGETLGRAARAAGTRRMLVLPKGEQNTPQYEALNPNMRMPTLKDGDYVLWESNAICQYLAAKTPESGLLPKDETARLDVTRWQFWDLAHWDPTCAVFAYEYV